MSTYPPHENLGTPQLDLGISPRNPFELSPPPVALREYQAACVQEIRDRIRNGSRAILLHAPTGSGKTILAAEIIRGAITKNKRSLFLAHRRELITQCSDKLSRFGVPHGIVMAGVDADHHAPVQVASIQTLWVRLKKNPIAYLPETDVLIIDEAHRALAQTYQEIRKRYPRAISIGLTATPVRGDGLGLGHLYDEMVQTPSVRELTDAGFLVPVRYFAPSEPDLHGVRIRNYDYREDDLEKAMDKPHLLGEVVENWQRICPDRKTIVFASGVGHSVHIRDQFRAAGIRAEHVDGKTPAIDRDAILAKLRRGEIQVITNCMVFTEGFDEPSLSCVILARPTKRIGLYFQMAGRVLRPSEGKADTILIDHSGLVYRHGFLDEYVSWSLSKTGRIEERQAELKKSNKAAYVVCRRCKTIYLGAPMCPNCKIVSKPKAEAVHHEDADLVELGPSKSEKSVDRAEWYRMLAAIQREKKYKAGWASMQFKAKFGEWPSWKMRALDPLEPSREVRGWITSQFIRYMKGAGKKHRGNSQR